MSNLIPEHSQSMIKTTSLYYLFQVQLSSFYTFQGHTAIYHTENMSGVRRKQVLRSLSLSDQKKAGTVPAKPSFCMTLTLGGGGLSSDFRMRVHGTNDSDHRLFFREGFASNGHFCRTPRNTCILEHPPGTNWNIQVTKPRGAEKYDCFYRLSPGVLSNMCGLFLSFLATKGLFQGDIAHKEIDPATEWLYSGHSTSL